MSTQPLQRKATRLYRIAGLISLNIWGSFSGPFHLSFSSFIAKLYHTRFSRHFIKPYCFLHYGDTHHYEKFTPGSGNREYQNFQDFFTRDFLNPPEITSPFVWPCEGHLCESAQVQDLPLVKIKGEMRHLRNVFGNTQEKIPDDYWFANVFLHNNNYHHIHAPVSGRITRIEHIPGKLLLLRPWAYKKYPSLPSLTNERINVDILDSNGKTWYLSIVGGPIVASIFLPQHIKVGAIVSCAEKIASFALGSTCCIAMPFPPKQTVGKDVSVGDNFQDS